jgi:hypothetical protein
LEASVGVPPPIGISSKSPDTPVGLLPSSASWKVHVSRPAVPPPVLPVVSLIL